MQNATMLSIIIPHYNSVNMLKKLLDSIPAQREIEILVVDDNSNKGLEALNSLKEGRRGDRILFLRNNSGKKGAGSCRNIGLEHANGEWILFADADDFFVNDFYPKVQKFLNTDNDVVFFTPTSIEVDTGNKAHRHIKYARLVHNYKDRHDIQSELRLRYEFSSPCSKLIRKELLTENNIYFDEVIASNDMMFSTKVGHLMKKFDASKEVIYCATRNKGSLTVNLSENIFDARLSVYINQRKFLKSNLKKEQIKKLNIKSPFSYVIKAFKSGLGLKKVIYTSFILKKNSIKFFHPRHIKYLSPIKIFRTIRGINNNYNRNKRHYVKDS